MNKKYYCMYLKQTGILFFISYIFCVLIGTIHFFYGGGKILYPFWLIAFFSIGSMLRFHRLERSEQSICHCVLAILVIYLFAYGLINFMDRLPFYEILTYDSELFLRSAVTADHILQYPLLLVIGYYLKVFYMDRKTSDIIFKEDDHIKIHF